MIILNYMKEASCKDLFFWLPFTINHIGSLTPYLGTGYGRKESNFNFYLLVMKVTVSNPYGH